jgi:hypothetical protein
MILQNVPEKYGKEDLGKFICKFCIEQVKTYQLQKKKKKQRSHSK